MDNQRVFVWAALALVLWLNYLAWQGDYATTPAAPAPAATTGAETRPDAEAALPELPSDSSEATPVA
ncbi:MAG: membrane protein insertase YidC, partial [Steroidobacter sp.]